jgi:DNA-binding transcriptional LysR family regulator
MDMQQMDYFLAVADCLNFTRAAEQLYISQPALWKQIGNIENELGVKLFERSKPGLRITPAGKALKRLLPSAKAHYANIIREVQAASQGFEGSLTIAVLDGQIPFAELTATIKLLHRENPGIDFGLFHSSYKGIRRALAGGFADAAITMDFDLPVEHDFAVLVLDRVKPMLATPKDHPLATKESISMADLAGEPLIVPSDIIDDAQRLIAILREKGFNSSIRLMKNTSSVALQVEAGIGVALMHEKEIIRGNPDVTLLPIQELDDFEVVLIWNPDNKNPALHTFISILSAEQEKHMKSWA